jgi:hypothetical protein
MGFAVTRSGFLCAAIIVTLATACAREEREDGATPEVALDSVDTRDEHTTYNGWTQYTSAWADICGTEPAGFEHDLVRSSGDSTRGGGACAVNYDGTACSSDTTCTSIAHASWGSQAYGYCFSGACYIREQGQAAWCVMNSNRAPGALGLSNITSTHVLGCMTKTAGSNTACGGTDSSLYVRTVSQSYWYHSTSPFCL